MRATFLLIPLLALALAGILYSSMFGGSSTTLVEGDLTVAAMDASAAVAEKLAEVSTDVGRVRFTDGELRDLLLASLDEHAAGRKLLAHANGLGARVVDDKLEVRVLLNAGKMREGLSEEERRLFDRAVATSRMAEDLDIDVVLVGVMSTGAGSLAMAPDDTTLKLSLLKLDLTSWAERVGYKRRDIERLLKFKLPGYQVSDARVTEDGVELAIRRL